MAEEVHKASILIVDDEEDHAQVMSEALERLGHRCDSAYNLAEAQESLSRKRFDVIVTDLMMEGRQDGLEVLKRAQALHPAPPVVLVTAHGDVPTAKAALKGGAYDFIEKPLDLDYFRAQVNRAAERASLQKQNQVLQEQIIERSGFEGIIGNSAGMKQVVQMARQVAASDLPVLILGESGTGKEVIATAIHNVSRRRKYRLVAVNCAGLSESILEDELFGHVKGAFTDARTDRAGRFEAADRGTLFLDEIGDMPQSMQAKLLRVLENGEVVRVGSNDPIRVDVRIISATNKDIEAMVAERGFREDLYFRIKGVTIRIPPLRERREDIPLLVHYFLQASAKKNNKNIERVSPEVQQLLMSYSWPGNVRQLKSTVETMVVLAPGDEIGADVVPSEIRPSTDAAQMSSLVGMTMEQAERELIRNTLKLTGGNREQAAKMLGIGERTLYRKIKEYGL